MAQFNHMTTFKKCKLVEEFCERFPDKKPYINNVVGALYPVGSVVKVADVLPADQKLYAKGFIGVVTEMGTRNDKFFYNLVILDYNGLPINTMCWYNESDLTLVHETGNYGLKCITFYDYNK